MTEGTQDRRFVGGAIRRIIPLASKQELGLANALLGLRDERLAVFV